MLSAPAPQVDSAEHNFLVSPRQAAYLLQHLAQRRAAAAAAHIGNNAKGTAIVAAVLNFQVGARAVARGLAYRRGEKIVLREDIANLDLSVVIETGHQVGDLGLVRIPHYPFDSR